MVNLLINPNISSNAAIALFLILWIKLIINLNPPIFNTHALSPKIPLSDIEKYVKLQTNVDDITRASKDYGNLVHDTPYAVLHPSSLDDIVNLIKLSNNCSTPFTVAARGRGHSVRGQAMARGGVVVDMASLSENNGGFGIRVSWEPSLGFYADVGGEQLWIDVLRAGLEDHGVAPVSWTDYLYLTVGGTLSNAGISGQSFLHGPQISNVLELDVITGKGELVTCSKHMNSELFFAVLGGLGQFGIITRARIVLHKAPTRAKWVRLLYSDFNIFTRDQERLISSSATTASNCPNYIEGSIIRDHTPPNNWRSNSFYTPSDQSKIASLLKSATSNQGLVYALELVKYYDDSTAHTIDQELDDLVRGLSYIPGFVFKKDVGLVDFLNRVGINRRDHDQDHDEKKKQSDEDDDEGMINDRMESSTATRSRPWLNLFVPKSRILDFNAGVFADIIPRHNITASGPILFYPFHKQKWDDRMSAVVPDEEIFYTLGLLHSCRANQPDSACDKLNSEILGFCEKAGIEIKQYTPYYKSKEDWMKHFGSKWNIFQERKLKFDPKMILSPGQRIFMASDN